ncbi:hypothetical protein EOPP23_02350 [Endozoicomonas sp. OPT23]|uniref:FAD-dependent oxidoreductase n=1 Tax=Endozoicomonas sp. OPT23 TaxID=2072845 RepID=UPI00129A1210|nr:FAD-dependent monooxygenase [Endozoicomonas sp. OPT23]MRI31836.1 hypothetical protein [Endozoicomonas sp. OPT23]
MGLNKSGNGVSGGAIYSPPEISSKAVLENGKTLTASGRVLETSRSDNKITAESHSEPKALAIVEREISLPVTSQGELISSEQLSKIVARQYFDQAMTVGSRAELDRTRMECFRKEGIRHFPVVVAGAGPAGLMAGIEVAKQGHKVCIVEARDEGGWDIRSSVLSISSHEIDYFLELLDALELSRGKDYVFSHRKKSEPTHHKSLGKLQEKIRGNRYKTELQVDVIQRILMAAVEDLYSEQITVEKGFSIEEIEPFLQTVQAKGSGKIIAFDNFIHADGTSGFTRLLLAQDFDIPIDETEFEHFKSGWCQCAYVHSEELEKLPASVSIDIWKAKYSSLELKKLQDLGWKSSMLPDTYLLKSHDKSRKVWVAGECPDNLSKSKQLEWNRNICKVALSQARLNQAAKLEDLSIVQRAAGDERSLKKNKLSQNVFELEKAQLDSPECTLVFGKSIAIGDAAKTPVFFDGDGVSKALDDAQRIKIRKAYRDDQEADDDATLVSELSEEFDSDGDSYESDSE